MCGAFTLAFALVVISCARPGFESATRDDPSFTNTFRHRFSEVEGVRMHFVEGGEGPVVVLVHGWPETWWGWRRVLPTLAERFQVIAVDLPGLGDSEGQPTAYDKKTLATYVHGLIAETLGHRRILLAGHDWGGTVAFQYAAQYPDEVTRLAVLELLLPGFRPDDLFDDDPTEESFHFAFHMAERFPELLVTGREREYLAAFFDVSEVVEGAVSDADVNEYVRTYRRPDVLHAGFELYRSLGRDAADNRASVELGRLRMPVLAMGGQHGAGPAVAASLRPATDHLREVVVADSGHWLVHEQPDRVASELGRFFTDG
ncbi:MAG: alpha/beta fold hydrolase [Actinobacteria bacterium]|nr:alpha/beta fold hydrolase [Actinomycetota bacterium]